MHHADLQTPLGEAAPHFHVAVVGAGPAGSALSLVLAGAGLSILLLEQSAFDSARVGELLSPDAVHVLSAMAPQLAQRLLGLSLTVVSAWSGPRLEAGQEGMELPWRAVNRSEFDRGLAEEAALRGAHLLTSARLAPPRPRQGGGWSLQLEHQGSSQLFSCDYLVDATGRASTVSRQLGGTRVRQNCQVAVVGFLQILQGQQIPPEMLLETTSQGWWYSAPLSATDAVAVFITDDDLDKGDPQEAWRQALEASYHTRARFASCQLKVRPHRVAAGSSILLPCFGHNWMAVGDAASCFDPLSIHGIGRALLHGVKAGEFLVPRLTRGEPINPFRLAEEHGEEFLKETVMLALNYQRVKQWPDSPFWQRRRLAQPSSEVRRQKRQPRQVPVSWGRAIDWSQYLQFESEILASPQLGTTLRRLRWELSRWACQPTTEPFETSPEEGEFPQSYLLWLENLLLGSLLCCLEHDPGQNSSQLFQLLVDDEPVRFSRIGWEGRFSELAKARQLQDLDWLKKESLRYQRELVQRKFLVLRAPLLHNLCLLSVLPDFLLTYALLFSIHRGADRIEREDFQRGIELAETEILTCGKLDQLPHTIVGFHLEHAVQDLRHATKR